ncbi:unnamed protein product [Rhizophagus irregularis]|nr:unnamed protein product [Rhizophagus irregularis]CAB4440697.1 unnamed protein product [Rhizophagus irregularis]
MRKKSSLNQWLRSGVVKQNTKNTLDSTLDTLYQLCQLNVTRESISRSLKDILRTDLTFRQEQQEHSKIYNWFQERQKKPTPISIIKKTRSSNNVAGSPNNIASTRDSSPPPIKWRYSFSEVRKNPPVSKDFRDADVLCMLKFIIENIKIFLKESAFHGSHKSKPIELLKDFKKDVRHKNAHLLLCK